MNYIRCENCGENIMEKGILIEGYLIYNTCEKDIFVPKTIETDNKEMHCAACGSKIYDKHIIEDIDKIKVIYPSIKEPKENLSFRCRECGNLSAMGIYSEIQILIIPTDKYYSLIGNYRKSFVEKSLEWSKQYIAYIMLESKEKYCNMCHEEITNLEKPIDYRQYIKNGIIKYNVF